MVYRQTKRSGKVREASRNRILRAARKLFARRGFEATTMRDIARAAGTSIGNLYFYFENKEALLEVLLAENREPLWEWTDQAAVAVPAGPARLAVIVYTNALSLLIADREMTRMLLRESGRPEVADRIALVYQGRVRRYLGDNFPEYPAERLDWAAAAWVGAARSCLERWLAGDLQGEPIELAGFVARWNLRALGVPEPEIDAAIIQAERVVQSLGLLERAAKS